VLPRFIWRLSKKGGPTVQVEGNVGNQHTTTVQGGGRISTDPAHSLDLSDVQIHLADRLRR
jgi:hypothetical protein